MSEFFEIDGHEINLKLLRELLKIWGKENYRDYPWRNTQNLYELMIAEFMLLRTRADQVMPVYKSFLDRFPDVEVLAAADRNEVMDALYSLGLSWRAEYMHGAAQLIIDEHGGEVPLDALESLPGASQYISAAIHCFGAGRAEPLIDANTVRIAGRLFGIVLKDSSRRSRHMRDILTAMLDKDHPREYNFALLDLGALVCKKTPVCEVCPLSSVCKYKFGISPLINSVLN